MKHFLILAVLGSLICKPLFAEEKIIKVGIIGLDTSHAVAFTTILNKGPKNPADAEKFTGVKVVAAYPQGSRDIETSISRVPEHTEKVKAMGVTIVDSIDKLLEMVDAVLLESNDGRVHLEQIRPVLETGKPVFIDKPVAASLQDVITIYKEAADKRAPVFSSSSLRYGANTQKVRTGVIGKVQSAETFSPAKLEATHPDLFWYGIHGVESLFTVMGTGCISVSRGVTNDGLIQVTGRWEDGRTGVFRESNSSDRKGYGGIARTKSKEAAVGSYDGYDPLLEQVVKFFKTGVSPVSPEETLEIYAFMEAADESKRQSGATITIKDVMFKAGH